MKQKSLRKIFLVIFAATLMLISGLPVFPVQAAGEIQLTVQGPEGTVRVGEEITFTVRAVNASVTNLIGFQFYVNVPNNLEYKPGSAKICDDFLNKTK